MSERMKAGDLKVEIKQEEPIWYDRKRVTIFALPWSFTKYILTPTKLIVESGLLNSKEEEIKLYRITDIEYSQTLFERIGKTGTITLLSNDTSSPKISLEHVKNAKVIKNVISQAVETARHLSGVKTSEMVGTMHHDEDCEICN
jgi:hypothetical protein